jgi:outer membrane receptor protein involved in Fe transport
VDVNSTVGNYNLDYQKTIQYSFGVKYKLSESYTIDISSYFKDEFDKIQQGQRRIGGLTRNQYMNKDYGRAKGFEFELEKRGGGNVAGSISYTYAFASGKSSQTTEYYLEDFYLSREPLSESPLDNDIRHSFKTAIQIFVPKTSKPRVFGLPIPNGWNLTIQSVVESGQPYTPSSKLPGISTGSAESIGTNSMRMPGTAVFDVRFNKEFELAGLDMTYILWVENVFDARNVVDIYAETGRPDTQQNISGVIRGGTEFDRYPYNWDYGRQIRMGFELNL